MKFYPGTAPNCTASGMYSLITSIKTRNSTESSMTWLHQPFSQKIMTSIPFQLALVIQLHKLKNTNNCLVIQATIWFAPLGNCKELRKTPFMFFVSTTYLLQARHTTVGLLSVDWRCKSPKNKQHLHLWPEAAQASLNWSMWFVCW